MSKELTVRDFMVGDIILAELGGLNNLKGMVTEIYKDKVKVMNWYTKEEEVISPKKCYGIGLTADLLEKVVGFEKHSVTNRVNAIRTETIEEWIKLVYDPENPEKYFTLIFPIKKNQNDPWILEVTDSSRTKKSSVMVTTLHELQNQVYFLTGIVLC